jgi:segregation and condensation protein B
MTDHEEPLDAEQEALEAEESGARDARREMSLDELSAAFAKMVGQQPEVPETTDEPPSGDSQEIAEAEPPESDPQSEGDELGDVSPLSILEAMLFVGRPDNEPLSSQQVASLMRGVTPQEVADLVQQLNARYDEQGCPYHVCSVGVGYQLLLRDEYASLRDKFYGRVREARLSQPALDVLAIVAYRQPLTRQQVDDLRGHTSGAILSQLVRRQLLRVERPEDNPRQVRYFTTDRFLDLFGLETLSELPQTHDFDKLL